MPLDFSKLPNWGACDKAKKALLIERKSFQYRDLGIELADDRSAAQETDTNRLLNRVNSKISSANILIATPGLDAEAVTEAQDELAALLVQRTRLLKRGSGAEDGSGFLTDVDAEQAAMQVAYLTTVIDQVDAHRLTLTS